MSDVERVPMRVAHSLVLDARDGSLTLEGVKLPYYLREFGGITDHEGVVSSVSVTLYADAVTVVNAKGETSVYSEPSLRADLEWAAREGRRIVHERMADTLHALWNSTATVQQALDVLGIDESQWQALGLETTHSDRGQSIEKNGDTA